MLRAHSAGRPGEHREPLACPDLGGGGCPACGQELLLGRAHLLRMLTCSEGVERYQASSADQERIVMVGVLPVRCQPFQLRAQTQCLDSLSITD